MGDTISASGMKKLLKFDDYLKNIFEDVYYSLKDCEDGDSCDKNEGAFNGIIDYFSSRVGKVWEIIQELQKLCQPYSQVRFISKIS